MVAAVIFVLRHVIDDDRPAAVPNFAADRRLDVEFAAGPQPKSNLVVNSTGDPTILSHARYRGNPIPVVRQITSRMLATASILETAEISAVRAASSLGSAGVVEITGASLKPPTPLNFAEDGEVLHVSQGSVKAKRNVN
jgi:hypothetical protein